MSEAPSEKRSGCTDPRELEQRSTHLGGMFLGNFDIVFSEKTCRCIITVRVRFAFDDAIAPDARAAFIQDFNRAAERWNKAARLVCDTTAQPACVCCCPHGVDVEVQLLRVNDDSYHKIVDVAAERRRRRVLRDVNVDITRNVAELAHEFGHVLGAFDEYDATIGQDGVLGAILGFLENVVGLIVGWRIAGHEQDTASIMNLDGPLFRVRHFRHIADWVNGKLPAGRCPYEVRV